jgi:hypothetical protein
MACTLLNPVLSSLCDTCPSELLQERTASPSAYTRATVVIAIKYTIVERPQPIDSYVKSCISSFLLLIKDEDRVSLFLPPLNGNIILLKLMAKDYVNECYTF